MRISTSRRNAFAQNRCKSLPCTVRTSRQRSCIQRVGCLLCSTGMIFDLCDVSVEQRKVRGSGPLWSGCISSSSTPQIHTFIPFLNLFCYVVYDMPIKISINQNFLKVRKHCMQVFGYFADLKVVNLPNKNIIKYFSSHYYQVIELPRTTNKIISHLQK